MKQHERQGAAILRRRNRRLAILGIILLAGIGAALGIRAWRGAGLSLHFFGGMPRMVVSHPRPKTTTAAEKAATEFVKLLNERAVKELWDRSAPSEPWISKEQQYRIVDTATAERVFAAANPQFPWGFTAGTTPTGETVNEGPNMVFAYIDFPILDWGPWKGQAIRDDLLVCVMWTPAEGWRLLPLPTVSRVYEVVHGQDAAVRFTNGLVQGGWAASGHPIGGDTPSSNQ